MAPGEEGASGPPAIGDSRAGAPHPAVQEVSAVVDPVAAAGAEGPEAVVVAEVVADGDKD